MYFYDQIVEILYCLKFLKTGEAAKFAASPPPSLFLFHSFSLLDSFLLFVSRPPLA